MSGMQKSLFGPPAEESRETLDGLNDELRRRIAALPEFAAFPLIPGEGVVGARVAAVGESPGPPDIATGRPFMGPAGDMLERILGSIGLSRSECYLTNAVTLVTTGEQITREMLGIFAGFLLRELRIVRPSLIIALGGTPSQVLLKTKTPISKLRGEFHDFEGIPVMPTFNPAYLLRDPTKKREVWDDILKVRDRLARLGPD